MLLQGTKDAPSGDVNRVLLVDDDALLLELASDSLAGEFEITTAKNPAEALAIIAAAVTPFDVICSDMHMPGMTGLELLAVVAERSPSTRSLLLTGTDEQAAKHSRHAVGVVTKPFRPSQLLELVRHLATNDLAAAKRAIEVWEDARGRGKRVA